MTGFIGILTLVLFIMGVSYLMVNKPIQAPLPQEIRVARPPAVQVTQVNEGGDDRYTRAPQPQRFWNNGPEIPPRGALVPPDGGMLINVPTQGFPERYQQMGVLKTHEGTLLPLFGRRTAGSSDRYNYYTRTDTYNPVQLPVRFERKDCQDVVGCKELMNGDNITIMPTGQSASVSLYRYDGPLYVPNII